MGKRWGTVLAVVLVFGTVGACRQSDDLDLSSAIDESTSPTLEDVPPDGATPTTTRPSRAGTGDTFVDPQGTYEIDVDPRWIPQHGGFTAEVEFWFTEPPSGRLATNVNVLTQNAPGVDLRQYLDLSVENVGLLLDEAEVIDSGIVQGTHEQLGYMEYRGTQAGIQMRFLGYFALEGGTAVVATLTSSEGRFDEVRGDVEPYLQTLRSIAA